MMVVENYRIYEKCNDQGLGEKELEKYQVTSSAPHGEEIKVKLKNA